MLHACDPGGAGAPGAHLVCLPVQRPPCMPSLHPPLHLQVLGEVCGQQVSAANFATLRDLKYAFCPNEASSSCRPLHPHLNSHLPTFRPRCRHVFSLCNDGELEESDSTLFDLSKYGNLLRFVNDEQTAPSLRAFLWPPPRRGESSTARR